VVDNSGNTVIWRTVQKLGQELLALAYMQRKNAIRQLPPRRTW
jgi:hypothetical protein